MTFVGSAVMLYFATCLLLRTPQRAVAVQERAMEAPLVIELYYSPSTKEELLVVGDSHTDEQLMEWFDAHQDALMATTPERV